MCHILGVECVYQDKVSDHSSLVILSNLYCALLIVPSFDPGSLAILERVDYVIQLLENQERQLISLGNQAAIPQQSNHILAPSAPNTSGKQDGTRESPLNRFIPSNTNGGIDMSIEDAATLMEALEVSASCSSNRILTWPIFESKVDHARINTYFFEPHKTLAFETSPSPSNLHDRPELSCRTYHSGRGIREEDVPPLVQEFLEKVHIKNPILDPPVLVEMARRVAEEGSKWDESSCLILIACALANLASDFSLTKPNADESSHLDAKDYATAEQYYTGARKRIGVSVDLPISLYVSLDADQLTSFLVAPRQLCLSSAMFFPHWRLRDVFTSTSQSLVIFQQRLYDIPNLPPFRFPQQSQSFREAPRAAPLLVVPKVRI
jgi:hypothetical protein